MSEGANNAIDITLKVIEDATKTKIKNVYHLIPISGPITFLSQQYRAFNLAWAVAEKIDREKMGIKHNKAMVNIGIVGAGITGMTAAAAFLQEGHHVTVFETKNVVAARQASTTHRWVHPTINFWPHQYSKIEPTTDLPYLNWYFGQCNVVVYGIEKDWHVLREFYSASANRSRVLECIRLKQVIAIRQLNLKKKIELTTEDGCKEFDYVILASGYKDETDSRFIANTPSYWKSDELETLISNNSVDRVIVSGAGDGGLLDALRASFRIRGGELIFELASCLAGTTYSEKLQNVNKLTPPTERENGYTELASILLAPGTISHKDESNRQHFRTILYSEVNRWAKAPIVVLLDQNFKNMFMANGAPIHKLLIACAVQLTGLKFYKGSIVDNKDNHFHIKSDSAVVDPVSTYRTFAVCRQGALTEHSLLANLSQTQKKNYTRISKKLWPDNYFSVPAELKISSSNHERAEKAIRVLTDGDINQLGVVQRGSQLVFTYRAIEHRPVLDFGKLFGVDLVDQKEKEEIEILAIRGQDEVR